MELVSLRDHRQQRRRKWAAMVGLRSVDNIAEQAREIVLDGEIAVSDDRSVTHANRRPAGCHHRAPAGLEAEKRPGWHLLRWRLPEAR
jgi:hypothetical protein